MTRWEYCESENLNLGELNTFGAAGWELVSVCIFDRAVMHAVQQFALYTFKRPWQSIGPDDKIEVAPIIDEVGKIKEDQALVDSIIKHGLTPPPNRWHTCTECGAVDFDDTKAIGSTLGVSVALCPNCASKENGWVRVRERQPSQSSGSARGYGA